MNRVSADRARQTGSRVNLQTAAFLSLERRSSLTYGAFDGVAEHGAHRAVQSFNLFVGELGRDLERGQSSRVQDLVGVGVPDARDQALIGQGPFDLGSLAAQQVAELRDVNRKRVRSEAGDAGHLGGISNDIYGEPLLGACFGEVEAALRAAVELRSKMQAERERTLARPGRGCRQIVAPLQPAGSRQVNDQVQPIDVEIQELAVSA